MTSLRILHVVGARPNFMKAAPVVAALGGRAGVEQRLAHTGQHYASNMSDAFFEQLGLPSPDINLEVGSGPHGAQTGQIMIRLEEELMAERPDLLIVYGDVNSTVAAALVGAKLQIPVAHVEAGLRSGDRSMPEEINRLVTDRISRLLFTPSRDGDTNLLSEGTNAGWIHFVGNVMIDSLVRLLPKADPGRILSGLGMCSRDRFCLVTLHRPSNVDDVAMLERVRGVLHVLAARVPVLFPVHPRTRARLGEGWICAGLHVLEPLGYLDFIGLQRSAALVVTDSGGVQEETTFLGVPCLTLRENTERPVTIEMGTNTLVGRDTETLLREALRVIDGTVEGSAAAVPPLWDGRAGERIADVIVSGEWRHSD